MYGVERLIVGDLSNCVYRVNYARRSVLLGLLICCLSYSVLYSAEKVCVSMVCKDCY